MSMKKAMVILGVLLMLGSVHAVGYNATPMANPSQSTKAGDAKGTVGSMVANSIHGNRSVSSGLSCTEFTKVVNSTRVYDFKTKSWSVKEPLSDEEKQKRMQAYFSKFGRTC